MKRTYRKKVVKKKVVKRSSYYRAPTVRRTVRKTVIKKKVIVKRRPSYVRTYYGSGRRYVNVYSRAYLALPSYIAL